MNKEIVSFNARMIVGIFDEYLIDKKTRILEARCMLGAWCKWLIKRGPDAIGVKLKDVIVKRAENSDRHCHRT